MTGGAGFIGSNLCERIASRGLNWQIEVVDNLDTGFRENLAGIPVRFHEADITAAELEPLVAGSDAVIHLAAAGSVARSIRDPERTFRNNVEGTFRLLEAVRRTDTKRFVFASSSSVYGGNLVNPKEETLHVDPLSPYAASKVAGEGLVRSYRESYGLQAHCLRFFNVYGPRQNPEGDYAAVIPRFINAALSNQNLQIYGDGKQSRDFTFVDNVTDAIIAAVDSKSEPELPMNISFGTSVAINELAQLVLEITESKSAVTYLPKRVGEVRNSTGNPKRFLREFEQSTSWVPLSEGLRRTASWYVGRICG